MFSNKRLFHYIFLLVITSAPSLFAQAKEVTVTRSQLWIRGQLKADLSPRWGILLREGSRYNLSYSKEINESVVDDETEEFWLQEFWIGAYYKRPVPKAFKFSANLLYRPQLWYPDESKNSFYTRHTVSSALNLNFKHKSLSLQYRLMGWGLFGVNLATADLDNEFIVRNLVGVTWSFSRQWQVTVSDEVFIKPTADDADADGTEFFYRNAVWAGINFKPVPSLQFSMKYVPFYTNKVDSPLINIGVFDHYVYFEIAKTLSLGKKSGKQP